MDVLNLMILLIFLGFALVFIGFILVFLAGFRSVKEAPKRVEGGGVIIVGPIPIVFGTSERITRMLLILAIVLTIVALVFFLATNYWFIGIRR